jgi:tellurite resistance protein
LRPRRPSGHTRHAPRPNILGSLPVINHHQALIYTMVMVSAADSEMSDNELRTIGELVQHLPVFRDFDRDRLTEHRA